MSTIKEENKDLRKLLRSKIGERRIQRSTKKTREHILDKTLKKIGIDKEQLKKDLENVKKQGGLELNIRK